nr:gamma-glutamylcyclotransferase family protein [Muriicola jejuensis]
MKSATAYLFSYGTLQESDVQKMIFSRTLRGIKDSLRSHTLSEEMVGGLYPTIRSSENTDDSVHGFVYVISEEELTLVDAYEGEAYERKHVTLESGIKAWVYLGKTGF